MEEENSCSSLLALTDSVLQLAQQDAWTPIELQHVSENQPADMWAETEMVMEQVHEMCQRGESQMEAGDSPEETEQWEQIMWPVHPLSCTNTPLSFATVEWDVPSVHVTDCSVANQLAVGSRSFVDTASLSLHHFQDIDDELLVVEGRAEDEDEDEEEKNWINSPLLESVLKETVNDPEVGTICEPESMNEPCDAVDEQGPPTQEKEDSPHELLDALTEVSPAVEAETQDECAAALDPAESVGSVDFTDILEDGDEALSFVHLKLDEELVELDVLLKGQEDLEDELLLPLPPPLPEGPETEEEKDQENKAKDEVEKNKVKAEEKGEKEHKEEGVNQHQLKEEKEKEEHKDKEVKEEEEEVEEVKEEGEEENQKNGHVGEDKEEEEEEHREEEGVKAKEQEVEGTTVEESHEERDVHSATLLVSENVTAVADLQPAKLLEEKRRSASLEDAEVPEESHEALSKESEMYKDVELKTDTTVNSEVVTLSANHPTINDSSAVEETKDQEASFIQKQEVLKQLQPSDERQNSDEEQLSRDLSRQPQHLEPLSRTEEESHKEAEERETAQPEGAEWPSVERAICTEAEHPTASERREQTEPVEQKEQTGAELQPAAQQESDESEVMEQQQPPAETAVEHQAAQVDEGQEVELQTELVTSGSDAASPHTVLANGRKPQGPEMAAHHANGAEVDRGRARSLAERLFNLDGVQRVDVVKHVDKDNDFSRAVGEEYLKFFDFTGQTLDRALRSFLKVVVLIGETQERERVLQHFSCRFHQCNPESFPSAGPVLALTCALMLLNTDLHGQNVGKSMSSSKFVSNLNGMNEGENFGKDLLKSLYSSIKSEPLQWAIDEGELMTSMSVDGGSADMVVLRSKTNPFQDVPHDTKAVEVKKGLLQRKIHADVDGKRTPWGKRGWKIFNGVLRGMVLYLQKVDYRSDQQVTEEVISVHHSLAERAADYTKKPYVFRLQTADWRVFLIQAMCKMEMYSWISRINLISALHSSPPFPAAVGSQRRFSRPILPSSQSAHTLERQLQSYSGMLESFRIDLSHLQSNPPEGKKAKAKELEEHRTRVEYLHHEVCRYETYVQVLGIWKSVKKTDSNRLNEADLRLFDKAVCVNSMVDEEEDEELKRSHSSPALEVEEEPSSVVKVKRNISERRTYRKPIIPRSSKDS